MILPLTFRAALEPGGPSFMPTQTIVMPAEVLEALGGKATKRVIVTIRGHALRLGLLPLEGGGRYLMLNKDLLLRGGLLARVCDALPPGFEPVARVRGRCQTRPPAVRPRATG